MVVVEVEVGPLQDVPFRQQGLISQDEGNRPRDQGLVLLLEEGMAVGQEEKHLRRGRHLLAHTGLTRRAMIPPLIPKGHQVGAAAPGRGRKKEGTGSMIQWTTVLHGIRRMRLGGTISAALVVVVRPTPVVEARGSGIMVIVGRTLAVGRVKVSAITVGLGGSIISNSLRRPRGGITYLRDSIATGLGVRITFMWGVERGCQILGSRAAVAM